MHELSLMQALFEHVETAAAAHRAKRVARLVVEVGEFSNVVPGLFQQAFLAFRTIEPLLEGAQLEIRKLPLMLECSECRLEFRPQGFCFRCPHCDSLQTRVIQGEELLLRDLELEVEEEETLV